MDDVIRILNTFDNSFSEPVDLSAMLKIESQARAVGASISADDMVVINRSEACSNFIPDHTILSIDSAVNRYVNYYKGSGLIIFGISIQKMFPVGAGDGEISVVFSDNPEFPSNLIVWELGGERAVRFESIVAYLAMLAEAYESHAYRFDPDSQELTFTGVNYFEIFDRYAVEKTEPFDY